MTTTEQTPTQTDEQLRAHSPWCRTSECAEGTPGLEWSHESPRVGEVVPAGQWWRRVSVNVSRHVEALGDEVHHETTVIVGLESDGAGQWRDDEAYSGLSPNEARALAAHLVQAADIAEGPEL